METKRTLETENIFLKGKNNNDISYINNVKYLDIVGAKALYLFNNLKS